MPKNYEKLSNSNISHISESQLWENFPTSQKQKGTGKDPFRIHHQNTLYKISYLATTETSTVVIPLSTSKYNPQHAVTAHK